MTQSKDTEHEGEDPFDGIDDLAPPTTPAPADALDPAPPVAAKPAAPKPPAKSKATAAAAAEPSKTTLVARIKPYNKRRGNLVRKYNVFGVKFEEGRGWYRVSKAMADYLERVTQDGNPDSPEVFDVVTEDQAVQLEARDRRRLQELEGSSVSSPSDPRDTNARDNGPDGVLTTRDLPTARARVSNDRPRARTTRRE